MTSDKRQPTATTGIADFVSSLRLAEGDPAALVGAFQRTGDAPSGEEIADLLWLWLRIRESGGPEQAAQTPHEVPDQTAAEDGDEPAPDDEPTIKLNVAVEHEAAEPPKPEDQQMSGAARGTIVNVPAAPVLLHTRELLYALRPLKRRVPARGKPVLDEQASVRRSADEGRLITVFRPPQERWLSVDLVVDQSTAMVLWHATTRELQRMLAHSGIFRDVRLWSLDTEAHPQEEQDAALGSRLLPLYPGLRRRESSAARSPRELIDPSGRRLILLISDAVSLGWQHGLVAQTIAAWSRTNPVTLIHMLPKNHWQRTALGDATEALLEAPRPGAPSAHLRAQRLLRWPGRTSEVLGVKLPVITLEPRLLHPWARSLAGTSGQRTPGYVLSPTVRRNAPAPAEPEATPNTLVEHFLRYASPTARELALLLAATPLTLPVINLVRAALLPHAQQTHVAEVVLSGLLYQRPTDSDPDNLIFEFHPGVRDLLLEHAPLKGTLQVMAEVGRFLDQLSTTHQTQAVIEASFKTISSDLLELQTKTTSEIRVFAKIQSVVLKKLGINIELNNHLDTKAESSELPNKNTNNTNGMKIIWDELSKRNNWALVIDETAFIRRAEQEMDRLRDIRSPEQRKRMALIRAYSEIIYKGVQDRHSTAFQEAWTGFYRFALRDGFPRDESELLAQESASLMMEKLDSLSSPENMIFWMTRIYQTARSRSIKARILETPFHLSEHIDDDDDVAYSLFDEEYFRKNRFDPTNQSNDIVSDIADNIISNITTQELIHAITRLLENDFEIVCFERCLIQGYYPSDLASELGVPAYRIRLAKSRILQRIRNSPEIIRLFRERYRMIDE